jgi:glycosyltransferase involved in cell wall biosynthesis
MFTLRIGFDTSPLYGPKTGIGYAVEAMHRALSERTDVALVDYLLSVRARPSRAVRRLPLPAALAHECWARSDHPRVDRWLGDVDVVHGTNYVVPPISVPRLVSVYDCWFLHHPDDASPAVRLAGRVLRRAIEGGAVVHASSHATARTLQELYPDAPVHTVHLAALPLAPPPAVSPIPQLTDRPFIVAIGTLERRKNLPRLVAAFGLIAAQQPELHLVLAGGDGDDREAINAAIDALGPHANRVLFTGRVDDAVRSWLLHHARVLAYPSLDEGFGFPLLDAMQAEVPIVASNAGSIPEVAGDAALLCDATDVMALASNLHTAVASPSVRAHLVATGREQLGKFSWDRCGAEMADLYRQVAAGSSQIKTE